MLERGEKGVWTDGREERLERSEEREGGTGNMVRWRVLRDGERESMARVGCFIS